MRYRLFFAAAAAAVTLFGGPAHAEFPEWPVTLVMPYSAGGPTDRIARDYAEALRKRLGQPVVIDNAAGAGDNIGAAKVARAKADGYTLLLHNIATATSSALYRGLQYRALEDFEYLGMVDDVPMTLVSRQGLPEQSLAELRAAAVTKPGKFTVGNATDTSVSSPAQSPDGRRLSKRPDRLGNETDTHACHD